MKEQKEKEIEKRSFEQEGKIELSGNVISGWAIRFNVWSQLIGGDFYEIIKPSAITQEDIDKSFIYMYYNHDEKKVLGVHRAKDDKKQGSLMLEVVENEGLRFMLELPDSEVGREVKQYIERGDLGGMSFGFSVHEDKNSDEWNYQFNCGGQSFEHPQLCHEIYKMRLYEISCVFNPAYPDGGTLELQKKRASDVRMKSDEINQIMDATIEEFEKL
jgi:caudovirus prohead protease